MIWKLSQKWSLKTKVTLFTICIFLGGIWSLFFYANHILKQDMAAQVGEHQLASASIIATTINQELANRFDALDETAEIFADLLSTPDALQAEIEEQVVLQYLFNGGIIVTGPDGTAIADLPKSAGRIGTNYGNDAWVADALYEGKSSLSSPIMGKHLHAPIFGMTVPVRDSQGTIIGSLGGVIDLAKPNFLDGITTSGHDKGYGLLIVAPQDRLIVTATDKQRIMKQIPPFGSNPGIDQTLTGEKASNVIINSKEEEVLASACRVNVAGWYVVISLPTAEVFAPIHTLQRQMLLATLGVTFFAGLFTWWLLRWQLSQLAETIETLVRYSKSELPLPTLSISRHDEVGELIAAFNKLLETLRVRKAALQKSHETLHSILSTSLDGYLRCDGQGRLQDVNATYCRQSGYSREELAGMKILDLEAIESEAELASHLLNIFKKGSDQFETQHRRKDGSIWDVEMSISYRESDGGQYFVFVRDVSERKQMEKARLTSQKMESLGTLAGGIAHDFNNILMIVQGNAHLAIRHVGSEHLASKNLALIVNAVERANDLVRRILAFSRPGELQTDVVDLRDVVNEALKLLRPILPSAVSLTTKFSEEMPLVIADSGQILEAIVNLTTNAAYAIGDLGGVIEYRLDLVTVNERQIPGRSEIDEGDYARLTVVDNGSGMDEQTLKHIFDAFYTTKPADEGTGLGLSMIYRIMKSHGGTVKVESAPGQGASFALYFPAIRENIRKEEKEATVQIRPPAGVRVLYVDDEESLACLAAEELSSLGYQVDCFGDPVESLAAFRTDPAAFDVVVTDNLMPNMSGFELARQILDQRPDVPVLLITGALSPEENRSAQNLGISRVIHKPLTIDKLNHELALVLELMG